MTNFLEMRIESETWNQFLEEANRITAKLDGSTKDNWLNVTRTYAQKFGPVEMFKKYKGKTLGQIFEEFRPDSRAPSESGTINGTSFALFKQPGTDESPVG